MLKKWEYQVLLKAFPADSNQGYLFYRKLIEALVEPLSEDRERLVRTIWRHLNVREEKGLSWA
jgi:hypothetical protein